MSPTLRNIVSVADVLGVSVAELISTSSCDDTRVTVP